MNKSFGQQWLVDWEDSRDSAADRPVPVAHFRPDPPKPPSAGRLSLDALRAIVVAELGAVLAPTWAGTIADRIARKILHSSATVSAPNATRAES
jgi:hypothetical protein